MGARKDHSEYEWRPVPGFEGVYRVARDGRVQRLTDSNHTRPGRLISPDNSQLALSGGGKLRSVVRATLVREVWGEEVSPRRPLGRHPDSYVPTELPTMRPRTCWCWDTIVQMLEDQDSATISQLAVAVYGDAGETSRRAMAMTACELAKPLGSKYVGGPYLVRVAWGSYALACDAAAQLLRMTEQIIACLRKGPHTLVELAAAAGVKIISAKKALTTLRRRRTIHSRRAPKAKWSGKAPTAWCNEYWLGRPGLLGVAHAPAR